MIELIRMIGVKGNMTNAEIRKTKTRAAKARATDEGMRRLKDGRAGLQLAILDDMRRSGIEWHNAKMLATSMGREAGNICRAMSMLQEKGLVECQMFSVGASDGSARKIKHYRLKEAAS